MNSKSSINVKLLKAKFSKAASLMCMKINAKGYILLAVGGNFNYTRSANDVTVAYKEYHFRRKLKDPFTCCHCVRVIRSVCFMQNTFRIRKPFLVTPNCFIITVFLRWYSWLTSTFHNPVLIPFYSRNAYWVFFRGGKLPWHIVDHPFLTAPRLKKD